MIEFKKVTDFKPGILYRLLCESYAELLKSEAGFAEEYKAEWRAEDDNAFNYPDSIGKCIFVSVLNNEPIGFGADLKNPGMIILKNSAVSG